MTFQVALITGASQGLGFEIARLYAQHGMGLIITARHADRLQRAAAELSTLTDIVAVAGDVADAQHARTLVEAGVAQFGRIDILINNASELGPSPMPLLEDLPPGELDRILKVNVGAPLQLIQLVLGGMRERGSGVIVNITSDAGVQAYPGWGAYGASKAALEHLSRILGAELDGSGVRVYVVDPGDMDTAMHRAAEPGVNLSHLPKPAVVAPAFFNLLDESAPFGRYEARDLLLEVADLC